ncbi:lysis protein [Enterobacter cloacae]|uniref:lysis protein n=1 Tax=Enterobacter chengduensis TaxID=2494701 RepID=UPI0027EBC90D|nr:lysis protein [Enterobacter chengduensis]EKS6507024.1 lysis protein [Enterobacter hormaechei]HDT6029017.1 lysis protein [Enterobacter cloacae subsp. cloacae]ELT6450926.1 lysis protein [Enterobacter hormaechei]EMF0738302.1 lysis protein [Enterobacter hormaechei]MDV0367654.1 lysis protein [Enterobacter chengduensis]
MGSEHYFLIFMCGLALFDRFAIRRKSALIISIGAAAVKPYALAFPILLDIRRSWISDAHIEYSLQDLNNPMVVITGKTRPLDVTRRGSREEFLLINTRYLESGRWDLKVRIFNGNCRLNPLYRIFPLSHVMEKQYTINIDPEGRLNVEG